MTEVRSLNTVPLPVRFRGADYQLLKESGPFDAYGETELLDGEIVYLERAASAARARQDDAISGTDRWVTRIRFIPARSVGLSVEVADARGDQT